MFKIFIHAVLILGAAVILMPYFWMFCTSFKSYPELVKINSSLFKDFLPEKWLFENYEIAWKTDNSAIFRGLINTLTVVIPSLILGIFSSTISAYAFAKMKFPGRDKIFFGLICMMMIPGVVTMVPSFIIFRHLSWLDTYLPMMVPAMFGSIAAVFFLRQFFMTIPNELIESAHIDGAGEFTTFVRIVVPCAKTAITTQTVLGFMGGYNDYLGPLLYLETPEKFTLQLALNNLMGFNGDQWNLIFAGAMMALIPSVIIFFLAQNFFIEGIANSGLKV